MHIVKKTAILAVVLSFMGIHLAEAREPKLFESPEHNANSTALLNCLAAIEEKMSISESFDLDGRSTYFIHHCMPIS